MIESAIHPFEAAGLGKAPFRYDGMTHQVCGGPNEYGVQIGTPGQPAGTCAYCGQGIAYCCGVRSADGKRFTVGCDCIEKLDASDRQMVQAVKTDKQKADAANRKARNDKRIAAELARIEAARLAFEASPSMFDGMPHPSMSGKSLRDYCGWMLKNAGRGSQLRIAKMIEAAAG